MTMGERLRALDSRVLGDEAKRAVIGQRYGWAMFLGLALMLLGFAAWALSSDNSPAMAVIPGSLGIGYLIWSAFLLARRVRTQRGAG